MNSQKAILEEVRASIEKQMYILNDRLMKNEERWRDVNHLLIKRDYFDEKPIILNKTVVLNDFLKSNGITSEDLILDRTLVFVLTPFNDMFAKEYEEIRNIVLDSGFDCKRGDEKNFASDIFPQMLKYIIKANLIIANLNGKNANVLYELGIAQALDKPVILIAKNPENLPIDIKSKRFLVYKDSSELNTLLKTELIKLLNNQLANKDDIDIIINSAIYKSNVHPTKYIDVTDRIRGFIRQGIYKFKAANENFGDPDNGFQKVLEINCTINGNKGISISALEGAEIDIIESSRLISK